MRAAKAGSGLTIQKIISLCIFIIDSFVHWKLNSPLTYFLRRDNSVKIQTPENGGSQSKKNRVAQELCE